MIKAVRTLSLVLGFAPAAWGGYAVYWSLYLDGVPVAWASYYVGMANFFIAELTHVQATLHGLAAFGGVLVIASLSFIGMRPVMAKRPLFVGAGIGAGMGVFLWYNPLNLALSLMLFLAIAVLAYSRRNMARAG